jgi:5-methylcytosine-specific restriction endonuclease McrA
MARKRGDFLGSRAWQELRRRRLAWAHYQCECCGATEQLQLDHVKARADGYHGRVGFEDVQVLCRACNQRKGTSWLTATQLRELLSIEPPRHRSVFSAKPRIG